MANEIVEALKITKMIPAPAEDVFDAWGNETAMKTWMAHGVIKITEAELDFRVGGKWSLLMKGEEGEYPHHGEYVEIDRPTRLAFTWHSDGTYGQETLVTVELNEVEGGTELTLTHERLPDERMANAHREGWTEIMETLTAYF